MKKTLLAYLIVVIFATVSFAAIKDSPDGFRGIKWGESPSVLGKDAKKVYTNGHLTTYKRPSDKLTIGEANLTSIEYVFFQNQLMSVNTSSANGGDTEPLKRAMIARYGKPKELDTDFGKYDANYKWEDKNAVITYKLTMWRATVTISSVKHLKLHEKLKDNAANKAKSDF